MSSPRYGGWARFHPASIVTDPLPALDGVTRDVIVVEVPASCRLLSSEAYLSSVANAPTGVQIGIFRDAGLTQPIAGHTPAGATATLTPSAAATESGGTLTYTSGGLPINKLVESKYVGKVGGAQQVTSVDGSTDADAQLIYVTLLLTGGAVPTAQLDGLVLNIVA